MAGNRYLERNSSGNLHERAGVQTSAGAGDAGKLIALDSTGKISTTMLPARFVSSNQTIVSGGAITLAHGLGATPRRIWFTLVNLTAELGYAIGNELHQGGIDGRNVSSPPISIIANTTNLVIRQNNQSPAFNIVRADTGANANITNASWALVFFAEL